jgi:hypothetical protein
MADRGLAKRMPLPSRENGGRFQVHRVPRSARGVSAIATSGKQFAIELGGWPESALDDAGSGSDPVARDVGYVLSPAPDAKSLASPAANGYPTGEGLGAGRSTIREFATQLP